MVIRSQNKEFIINFEKVDTVCLGGIEGKSVITFTCAQVVTLGEYSTKEKAIKVLDMIEKSYVESVWTEGETIIANRVCFEMPQDDKVNELLAEVDMEINYPYKMTISNKAEAVDAIMHMCDNCDNFFLCTGAMSSKCNEVKEKIKEEFTKSEF